MLRCGGLKHKLDYQPLFGKGARRSGGNRSHLKDGQDVFTDLNSNNCFFKLTLLVHRKNHNQNLTLARDAAENDISVV